MNDVLVCFHSKCFNSCNDHQTVFTAADASKVPPIAFSHLDAAALLNKIVGMQQELSVLRATVVTKSSLREDIAQVIPNLKTSTAQLVEDPSSHQVTSYKAAVMNNMPAVGVVQPATVREPRQAYHGPP